MGEIIVCDICTGIISMNEVITYLTIYQDFPKTKTDSNPMDELKYMNEVRKKALKYELCPRCMDVLKHVLVLRKEQVEALYKKFKEIIECRKVEERNIVMKSVFEVELERLVKEIPDIASAEKLPNIYFVAKAGAGKTFSANFLIQKYGFEVAKFAYPVYMIAEKYFGMKEKDRKLLQVIGTDSARDNIDSEIWVKRFRQDMKIIKLTAEKMNRTVPQFVMDDCRFPNEHAILKELGFVGIYIDVPDEVRKVRLVGRDGTAQEGTLNHKSETLIDTFKKDLISVDGSGSLEMSLYNLNNILQEIIK